MQLKVAALITVAAVACCPWQPVAAAVGPESCVTIADDAQRLACYDEAFGRASRAAAVAPAAPAGKGVLPLEAPAEFGLSPQMRLEREQKAELKSITAKIAKVSRSGEGRLVFTLDNGQVWLQTETQPRIRVKPGDTVTIKRALMGSFLLVTEQTGSTRAKRIE